MSGVPFDDEAIRLAVYRDLAATGRAPEPPELAARLGVDQAVIREGLRRQAHGRHLVLDTEDRVLMAHPFASVPLGFSVMGRATLVGRVRLGLIRPAPPASG